MSFEKLQELWTGQTMGEVPLAPERELLDRVRSDSSTFDQSIKRRDRREILAGLFLVVCYLIPARQPHGPAWAFWAALLPLVALTAFFFSLQIYLPRKRRTFSATLEGELAWSLFHTRYQIMLLTHVAWWYLLPCLIAGFFHSIHRKGALTASDGWTLPLFGGVFLVVYWLNQRAVRQKLRPQLAQLLTIREQWQSLERADTPASR